MAKPKVQVGSAKTPCLKVSPMLPIDSYFAGRGSTFTRRPARSEAHIPIDQRKNRVVAAEPDILAR